MSAAASLALLPAPPTRQAIQQAVLAWFAAHGRDLPWRHTRDPYHILVAEMMLQQTQVDRVLPKYAAFLAAFPTLAALAAAPSAEVIKQWAGLGYNRRAVNMQRIARLVHDDHGGQFPRTVAELRALPGIGPYTAGALACFAFEQDVGFIDTNIRRVLRRLLAGPPDAPPATSDRELSALAEALVPAGQGWSWNQGIMELGALLCTASAPACWRCPLRAHCRAYAAWRSADEQVFAPAAERPPRPARRVAERKAAPFVGSRRYYRGRLVERLRALPTGATLTLDALGPQVKDGYAPAADAAWLRGLVDDLTRDGLAAWHGATVGLPT